VLRCPLEFGKDREVVAGILGGRMRNLKKYGAIALHDERTVGQSHLNSLAVMLVRPSGAHERSGGWHTVDRRATRGHVSSATARPDRRQ
jgi:hypothetical protein